MTTTSYAVRLAARAVAVVFFIIITTGCASIVKGSTQSIPISSDPPGADIIVDGSLMAQTPTNLKLKRKHDHLVTIQKTGYHSKAIPVVKDVGGAVSIHPS